MNSHWHYAVQIELNPVFPCISFWPLGQLIPFSNSRKWGGVLLLRRSLLVLLSILTTHRWISSGPHRSISHPINILDATELHWYVCECLNIPYKLSPGCRISWICNIRCASKIGSTILGEVVDANLNNSWKCIAAQKEAFCSHQKCKKYKYQNLYTQYMM